MTLNPFWPEGPPNLWKTLGFMITLSLATLLLPKILWQGTILMIAVLLYQFSSESLQELIAANTEFLVQNATILYLILVNLVLFLIFGLRTATNLSI